MNASAEHEANRWRDVVRAKEWWGYKLTTILLLNYIVVAQSHAPAAQVYAVWAFALLTLSLGAAYVSVINDWTDLTLDAQVGKPNRLTAYSRRARILLVCALIGVAALSCVPLWRYPLALAFYLLAFLSFTLYSVPPARFKVRGVLGVLSDGAGSQLFPALYVLTLSAAVLGVPMDTATLWAAGLWSLGFGLRGILYHQFKDRENDAHCGIRMVVHTMSEGTVRVTGAAILVVEIAALCVLLLLNGLAWALAALPIYAVYAALLVRNGTEIVSIRPLTQRYVILMAGAYEVILPLLVLLICCSHSLAYIGLLALHIGLFHDSILRIWRHLVPNNSEPNPPVERVE